MNIVPEASEPFLLENPENLLVKHLPHSNVDTLFGYTNSVSKWNAGNFRIQLMRRDLLPTIRKVCYSQLKRVIIRNY